MNFILHDVDTAPEASRTELAAVAERFGFIPNIFAVMADSPAVLKAYSALGGLLASTDFTPAEQQLLLLAISAANGCEYCVAAHTGGARKAGLDEEIIEAVRSGGAIADPKLAVLAAFARSVVDRRGHIGETEIETLMAVGYDRAQALEVVLAVAMKTLSNTINHFAETPLDPAFEKNRWRAADAPRP